MTTSNRLPPFRLVLPCALAWCAGAAVAQARVDAEAPRPAPVMTLQYVSPLAAYQRYAEQAPPSWRAANDRVGRIGGWRAYARESQSDAPASASDAAAARDPHAGHHREGQP